MFEREVAESERKYSRRFLIIFVSISVLIVVKLTPSFLNSTISLERNLSASESMQRKVIQSAKCLEKLPNAKCDALTAIAAKLRVKANGENIFTPL